MALVACVRPQAEPSLRQIMKERLNDNLSAIALDLHHDDDPAVPADPLADIEQRALDMAEAARLVARRRPPRDGDVRMFQTKARCLSETCQMLANAAHERDRTKLLHWFFNTEWACHSCHAQFRGPHSER